MGPTAAPSPPQLQRTGGARSPMLVGLALVAGLALLAGPGVLERLTAAPPDSPMPMPSPTGRSVAGASPSPGSASPSPARPSPTPAAWASPAPAGDTTKPLWVHYVQSGRSAADAYVTFGDYGGRYPLTLAPSGPDSFSGGVVIGVPGLPARTRVEITHPAEGDWGRAFVPLESWIVEVPPSVLGSGEADTLLHLVRRPLPDAPDEASRLLRDGYQLVVRAKGAQGWGMLQVELLTPGGRADRLSSGNCAGGSAVGQVHHEC
jgi:hypothetical protein